MTTGRSASDERDIRWMRLALAEAARANGRTAPNPMVGCVIVKNEQIVATGFHARAGEPHAEVVALEKAGEAARGAELFVSLEPCSHFGRTPPCVDAVRRHGVRRVVAAMIDPDPRVSGRGMRILEESGIETRVGVCESDARRLNEGFISRITRSRPFVTVKLAISLDGKIATRTGDSQWISGEQSRAKVHEMRALTNAISVGPGTAKADDPRLTARPSGETDRDASPGRYVVEGRYELPVDAHIFETEQAATTLFTASRVAEARRAALERRGVRIVEIDAIDDPLGVRRVTGQVFADGGSTLLVEGGGEFAGAFFDAGLVDRLVLFMAPRVIGGRDAVPAIGGRGAAVVAEAQRAHAVRVEPLGDDLWIEADLTEL